MSRKPRWRWLYCNSFHIECQEGRQTVRAWVGRIPLRADQASIIPRLMESYYSVEQEQQHVPASHEADRQPSVARRLSTGLLIKAWKWLSGAHEPHVSGHTW